MSMAVGSLSFISLRNPFKDLVDIVLGKGNVRSMLCLVVFCIVFLVLAYLTNPSENSFRAYLTEQSFRQHLNRLNDHVDDEVARNQPASRIPPTGRTVPAGGPAHFLDKSSPFHFANRAAISLRTPKHVFHSFAIFTIAAMVPTSKSDGHHRDGWMIPDSWYIGAFGRWWYGGVLEAWYQDVITRSKDEESWNSGIISMKSLDMLHDYNGPTFSAMKLPPYLFARGSPPKLRGRDRSSQRPSLLSGRSSTPPPLPKTASLPLHAIRQPVSTNDRPCILNSHSSFHSHIQSNHGGETGHDLPTTISKSPSTLFDQSPIIADVLRQISISKTSVQELRIQLSDFQSAASHSHSLLQEEVDSFRNKKRQEDATRLDMKSKTKTLDDSKRSAEGIKRDAEKKLKVAQNTRDGASQRIKFLDKEIALLRQRLRDDEAYVNSNQNNISKIEQDMIEAMETKRNEIKVAEDLVGALSQRSRELEDKLNEDKERLRLIRQRVESRKQEYFQLSGDASTYRGSLDTWHANPCTLASNGFNGGIDMMHNPSDNMESFSDSTNSHFKSRSGRSPSFSRSGDYVVSSVHGTTSLASTDSSHPSQPASRMVYEDSLANVNHHPQQFLATRAPFTESDAFRGMSGIISSASQPFMTAGMIDHSDNLSRSFHSDNDLFLEKDWRGSNAAFPPITTDNLAPGYTSATASPTSLHGSMKNLDHDPFEVRAHLQRDNMWDTQRATWVNRSYSDPKSNVSTQELDPGENTRRWFPIHEEKPKKGLNPDAKAFNLFRRSRPGPTISSSSPSPIDALNPNGLGSSVLPTTTSSSSLLLRAFAPSPAEREALQRVLGSSSNTSFERLPSLSDVSSIPSSPSHVHAHVAPPQPAARDFGRNLPSWLQSLPRIRKVNFSPWDDEEPTSTNGEKDDRVYGNDNR